MGISQEQLFKKMNKLELWLENIADSLEENNELIEELLEAITEDYERVDTSGDEEQDRDSGEGE